MDVEVVALPLAFRGVADVLGWILVAEAGDCRVQHVLSTLVARLGVQRLVVVDAVAEIALRYVVVGLLLPS